jgi:hypothetical protein
MHTQIARRSVVGRVLGVAAVAAALVFATPSPGGPPAGAIPFTLPMPSVPKDVWNGPATTRTGIKVHVPASSPAAVQVQVTTAGVVSMLGDPVEPGESCVFEGFWDSVQVTGVAANATGSVEICAPSTGYAGNDGTVAAGIVNLPVSGGTQSPYLNFASPAVNRLFTVHVPGPDPVRVTTTPGGTELTLSGNDWSFLSVNAAQKLTVVGKGVVDYMVYDMRQGNASCGSNAFGTAGSIDRVAVDGAMNLSVRLVNSCTAPIMVVSQVQGAYPLSTAVPPGPAGRMFMGALTRLEWTYGAAGSVAITVSAP